MRLQESRNSKFPAGGMPPDPPRGQGPPGLATPTQINATPTSKTVENTVHVQFCTVQDANQQNV